MLKICAPSAEWRPETKLTFSVQGPARSGQTDGNFLSKVVPSHKKKLQVKERRSERWCKNSSWPHMQCWPIPQNRSSRCAFRSGRGTGFSVQTMKLVTVKEKVPSCDKGTPICYTTPAHKLLTCTLHMRLSYHNTHILCLKVICPDQVPLSCNRNDLWTMSSV